MSFIPTQNTLSNLSLQSFAKWSDSSRLRTNWICFASYCKLWLCGRTLFSYSADHLSNTYIAFFVVSVERLIDTTCVSPCVFQSRSTLASVTDCNPSWDCKASQNWDFVVEPSPYSQSIITQFSQEGICFDFWFSVIIAASLAFFCKRFLLLK